MLIQAGYTISYDCPSPTPMLLNVSVHPSRAPDLRSPAEISFTNGVTPRTYLDDFGNLVTRILCQPGRNTLSTSFLIEDSGLPDLVPHGAIQLPVEALPDDVLIYLLGSRYCETDRLTNIAWSLFGASPLGWPRVQAVLDFVHSRIRFDYQRARPTRTAFEAYEEREGVCRDFAHLAVAFCRCMNIPARYCTGYLGDIGIPPVPGPMDFSAWFEVYLGGAWYTADARHNTQRIGRILMARGRDATDVAISNSFGTALLAQFDVVTDLA